MLITSINNANEKYRQILSLYIIKELEEIRVKYIKLATWNNKSVKDRTMLLLYG